MNIAILEPLGVTKETLDDLLQKLNGHEIAVYDEKTTDTNELIRRAKDADVIVIANNPLRREVIEACKKLKMISVAFVGIDHIDQDACKKQNITISNAADYCTFAVSELAIGLTIAVLRNIPRCDTRARAKKTKDGLVGNELYAKTFGVVGTGAIGIQTARVVAAFGCRVIGYSRSEKEAFAAIGEYVSLEILMSESDVVSLHTPLTTKTKNLIDRKMLDLMKPSAILINTARGPVVDNAYLHEQLKSGRIAGAGIDVFDVEPPLRDEDTLIQNETAVLTPHVAFATAESIERRASIVIDNIVSWIAGTPQNRVL